MFGPILDGTSVRLVPPREEFLPSYCHWLADIEITKFLLARLPFSLSQEKEWFERTARDPDGIHWAVLERESEQLIGDCCWKVNWRHRRAEWGFMIGERAFHGRGLGTDMLRVATRYAFDELGLEKVESRAMCDNVASVRAHERVGFRLCGIKKRHFYFGGRMQDEWMGELLREEWNDVGPKIEPVEGR